VEQRVQEGLRGGRRFSDKLDHIFFISPGQQRYSCDLSGVERSCAPTLRLPDVVRELRRLVRRQHVRRRDADAAAAADRIGRHAREVVAWIEIVDHPQRDRFERVGDRLRLVDLIEQERDRMALGLRLQERFSDTRERRQRRDEACRPARGRPASGGKGQGSTTTGFWIDTSVLSLFLTTNVS
jgi:hypothetical protein